MLEIESGSNDPFAYMLTMILLFAMGDSLSLVQIIGTIFSQIFVGLAAGSLIAWTAGIIMKHVHFGENGLDSIFLAGTALASYAIPSLLGGNGYLSAYLAGILLGNNQEIPGKKGLVNFFDALNGMMQMLIFFLFRASASSLPTWNLFSPRPDDCLIFKLHCAACSRISFIVSF